ncbi:MAG: response regulator [Bryobacteraceae bacterium]|jgi:DNA-binding response OmpR family regulator
MAEAGSIPKSHAHPAVLVVEDQEPLRHLIVRFLSRQGIQAFDADSAGQGLSIVRRRAGRIDLAILDLVMPGVSGLDLATDLIREYPGIKILYISGYVESIAMDVIARRSPGAVLLKPFTEQMLLERVHQLLEMPTGIEPGAHSL